MNWTEEDIDQLFRDSASQLNVPFQESYWTEMEALLPQTKTKKGLGWIFGGTIICFALISTFFFAENTLKTENTASKSANSQSTFISHVNSVSPIQDVEAKTVEAKIIHAENITLNAEKSTKAESRNQIRNNNILANAELSASSNETFVQGENLNLVGQNQIELANQIELPVQIEEQFSIQKLQFLVLPNQVTYLATSNFKNLNLKRKPNTLYVQIGAGLTESFMQTNALNWMPTINIGGGYQYSPRGFGFTAGLNLNTTFSNNLEINRKSKVYNFGSTNYEQNFKYKQIYTLELPVSIDFRKNKQTFSLGISPTFIAGSLMRFSQSENGNLSHDEFYIGQKVGLKHFGLKPSIGYQLELAKGWNLGIQLNMQLIQQVDDSQFIGKVKDNPLSGQFTIRKTITKF
jgi:hypothetical protein